MEITRIHIKVDDEKIESVLRKNKMNMLAFVFLVSLAVKVNYSINYNSFIHLFTVIRLTAN